MKFPEDRQPRIDPEHIRIKEAIERKKATDLMKAKPTDLFSRRIVGMGRTPSFQYNPISEQISVWECFGDKNYMPTISPDAEIEKIDGVTFYVTEDTVGVKKEDPRALDIFNENLIPEDKEDIDYLEGSSMRVHVGSIARIERPKSCLEIYEDDRGRTSGARAIVDILHLENPHLYKAIDSEGDEVLVFSRQQPDPDWHIHSGKINIVKEI